MLNGETVAKVWRYKVYIQDDNGNWVDFSAKDESYGGVDALVSLGNINVARDSNKPVSHIFASSDTQVALDNTNFWLDGADFKPRFSSGYIYTVPKVMNIPDTTEVPQIHSISRTEGRMTGVGVTNAGFALATQSQVAIFQPDNYTFSCGGWFRQQTSDIGQRILINLSGTNTGFILFQNGAGDQLKFTIYRSGGFGGTNYLQAVTIWTATNLQSWHHYYCVCEYNSVTTVSTIFLYIDGVLQASANYTNDKIEYNPLGNLYLCGRPAGTAFYPISCANADFYAGIALTPKQVISKYQRGVYASPEKDQYVTAIWDFSQRVTGSANIRDLSNDTYHLVAGISSSVTEPASTDSQLARKISPALAHFGVTKGGLAKTWKGRKVKITIETQLQDQSFVEDGVATFFIKNTQNEGQLKILQLESRSSKLKNRFADTITDGGSWYENANYKFIISKLLKTELSEDGETLPANFIIPNIVERLTRVAKNQYLGLESTNTDPREFSILGRPPELDGLSSDGNLLHKAGFPTAQCIWQYSTGTIYTDVATSRYKIYGNGTDWIHATEFRPVAGDAITIKDVRTGNTTSHEIVSIDSDTEMTIKEPLVGYEPQDLSVRTDMYYEYVITRIYLAISYIGINESDTFAEIWKYIPAISKSELLLTMTLSNDVSFTYGAIYQLKINDANDTLQGIMFQDIVHFEGMSTTTGITDRRVQGGMYFECESNGGEIYQLDTTDSLMNARDAGEFPLEGNHYPITGLIQFRTGSFDSSSDGHVLEGTNDNDFHVKGEITVIGQQLEHLTADVGGDVGGIIGGEMIAIPFAQVCGDIGCRGHHTVDDGEHYFPEPSPNYGFVQQLRKYPAWIYGNPAPQYNGSVSGIQALWTAGFEEFWTNVQELYYDRDNDSSWLDTIHGDSGQSKVLKPFYADTAGYYGWASGIVIQDAATWPNLNLSVVHYPYFRYSINSKGAFTIHPGDTEHSQTVWQNGGPFYFVGYQHSEYIGNGDDTPTPVNWRSPQFGYDYYCLITPFLTGVTSNDVKDTAFWFTRGLNFKGTYYPVGRGSSQTELIGQPTTLEHVVGTNTFILGVTAWSTIIEQTSGTPANQNYPFTDETTTKLYRFLWEYHAANASLDLSSFSGRGPVSTSSSVNVGTTSLDVGVSVSTFHEGDIIRFDDGADILYARVNRKSGNIIYLSKPNGLDGTVGEGTVNNARINIVGEMVFETRESSDGTDNDRINYGNISFLETKTVSIDGVYNVVWASFLRRDKVGTPQQYGIGYLDLDSGTEVYKLSQTSWHSSQPEGLVESINEFDGFYRYIHFFCGGGLFSKSISTNLVIRNSGDRPVKNENWLCCNTVIDGVTRDYPTITDTPTLQDTDIIYAVTAPTPPHYTQETPAHGKYYMIKYDNYVSLRVPLADFSDKKVWEVIGYLAQKADYTMGFADEVFYMLPNNQFALQQIVDAPITLHYEDDNQESDVIDIESVDFAEDDVINVVKCKPYSEELAEAELSFVYVPRKTYDSGLANREFTPNVAITAQQRDKLRKHIQLTCVTGGFISRGKENPLIADSGKPVRFRYKITQTSWETTLRTATTVGAIDSNGYLYISDGAEHAKVGDILEIHYTVPTNFELQQNGESNDYYLGTYYITDTTNLSLATQGQVKVSLVGWTPDLQDNIVLPIGTRIAIYPSNQWSDSNINLIKNGDFEDWTPIGGVATRPTDWNTTHFGDGHIRMEVNNSYLGTRCIVWNPAGNGRYVYQNLTLKANTTYKVSARVRGSCAQYISFSDFSDGTFTLDKGYLGSYSTPTNPSIQKGWVQILGTFTTGADTSGTINLINMGSVLSQGWWDSVVLAEGYYIKEDYFVIPGHNIFAPIGDSNVYLKFEDDNEGNYEVDDDKQETFFVPGDAITINCEGLSLKQDAANTQSARYETSVRKYGVNELELDNPYLTLGEAKNIIQDIVTNYGNPKQFIKVKCKMRPGLHMIDLKKQRIRREVDVVSKVHFPNEQGYRFKGILLSIDYQKDHLILSLQNSQLS